MFSFSLFTRVFCPVEISENIYVTKFSPEGPPVIKFNKHEV